jgi:hypothetical protein
MNSKFTTNQQSTSVPATVFNPKQNSTKTQQELARQLAIQSDVDVPMEQAKHDARTEAYPWTAIVGILTITFGGILLWTHQAATAVMVFIWGGIITGSVYYIMYTFNLRNRWRDRSRRSDSTLWNRAEEIVGIDLDGDGKVGKKETNLVLVHRNTTNLSPTKDHDEGMVRFVRGCFQHNRRGVDFWEKQGMSRDEYTKYVFTLSNNDMWDTGAYIEKVSKNGNLKGGGWRFKPQFTNANEVVSMMFPKWWAHQGNGRSGQDELDEEF